jgi:hypothetical protein
LVFLLGSFLADLVVRQAKEGGVRFVWQLSGGIIVEGWLVGKLQDDEAQAVRTQTMSVTQAYRFGLHRQDDTR